MKINLRKKTRTGLDFLGRLRVYFFRGHNSWLYFPIWFVNILIVIYKLLLEDLEFLPDWISFWVFALLFPIIYFPLAVIIGRFDYYKGTYKGEAKVSMYANPIWIRQFNELQTLREELKDMKNLLQETTQALNDRFKKES